MSTPSRAAKPRTAASTAQGLRSRLSLKAVAVNLGLFLFSSALILILGEATLRALLVLSRNDEARLEDELARSEREAPKEQLGDVRIGGLIRSSPLQDVVYELKPNVRATFQGQPYSSNEWGMRDQSYSREKAPGVFRIAGLGDSVMFGWGVAQEAGYLSLIEEQLKKSAPLASAASQGSTGATGPSTVGPLAARPVEVLNFAVPGYNTTMEIALFEKRVLGFAPDLVVLHFVNNDYQVPFFMMRPSNPLDFSRSYLREFFAARFGSGRDSALLGANLEGLNRVQRTEVIESYRHMVGEGAFRNAMKRLADLTHARNIPVVVVVGTVQGRMKRRLRKTCAKWGFHLLEVGIEVQRLMAERGVNTEEGRREALRLSPTDAHPNALGHELYAKILLDFLISRQLLPLEKTVASN